MKRSTYIIKQLDCAAEENLIRMKLNDLPQIQHLDFDIPNRKLTVTHEGSNTNISATIDSLNFNSRLHSIEDIDFLPEIESPTRQTSLLWKVLAINLAFFVIEVLTGIIANSMGLVADGLDMFADVIVYGLSLLAIGGAVSKKKRVAAISGYLQITLAMIGFAEIVRRFFGYEEFPDYRFMIIISIFALVANAWCLYLLQKSKSKEAHMQASMIFTSNDVIINLGVIVSGALVLILQSKYPDLIIGAIVFVIVARGALSILKLSK